MSRWPRIVENFPLSIDRISSQYAQIPTGTTDDLYHYTSRAGVEGILRCGGLRARHRNSMNDKVEFEYANNIIKESLAEFEKRNDLPPKIVKSLTSIVRIILQQINNPTQNNSVSYCACLSVSPDHQGQWGTYAEQGQGFALGINFMDLLRLHKSAALNKKPYFHCMPVCYNQSEQFNLVPRLFEGGINDMRIFADTVSNKSEDLTALRDKIAREIVTHLFHTMHFFKSPDFSSEREIRFMHDANDETTDVNDIQYFESGGESVPFVFFDLRDPNTGRLPLSEIKIGPKATFSDDESFLHNLIDELGYGSDHNDRPRIVQSSLAE